jgi:hypothetical protein
MSVVGVNSRQICCWRSTSTGTRRVVGPSGWGVVNSMARRGRGPVGLVHTQNLRFFYKEKPTCGFGECPLWMEERTLSISGSRSAFDPNRTSGESYSVAEPNHRSRRFCPREELHLCLVHLSVGRAARVVRLPSLRGRVNSRQL